MVESTVPYPADVALPLARRVPREERRHRRSARSPDEDRADRPLDRAAPAARAVLPREVAPPPAPGRPRSSCWPRRCGADEGCRYLVIAIVRNPLDVVYSAWRRFRYRPEAYQWEWRRPTRNLELCGRASTATASSAPLRGPGHRPDRPVRPGGRPGRGARRPRGTTAAGSTAGRCGAGRPTPPSGSRCTPTSCARRSRYGYAEDETAQPAGQPHVAAAPRGAARPPQAARRTQPDRAQERPRRPAGPLPTRALRQPLSALAHRVRAPASGVKSRFTSPKLWSTSPAVGAHVPVVEEEQRAGVVLLPPRRRWRAGGGGPARPRRPPWGGAGGVGDLGAPDLLPDVAVVAP